MNIERYWSLANHHRRAGSFLNVSDTVCLENLVTEEKPATVRI